MNKNDQNREDGELVEDEAVSLDDEQLDAVSGGVEGDGSASKGKSAINDKKVGVVIC